MSSTTTAPEWTAERFTGECDYCRHTARLKWAFDGVTAICVEDVACVRRIARQRKLDEFQPIRTRRELRGERTELTESEQDERAKRRDHTEYTIEQCRIRRKVLADGAVVLKPKRERKGTYSGGNKGYWMPSVSSLKPEVLAWWGKLTPEQQATAKANDLKAAKLVNSYEMGRRSLKALREAK